MWAAIKLLSWQIKAGIAVAVLAILLAIIGSTATIYYNKGLNVSKVEIVKYESKVRELNTRIAQAQGRVDVQVVTQYKDRVEYVDRIVYKTRTVIEQSVPEQFHLSKGWIYAYNQSVQGLELDPVLAANKSPASVTEMRALSDTIAPNNGICLLNKTKLDSLQGWILATEAAREQVTK